MTMTLYHGEPNGPSLTVLAAFFEKSVDAELVRVDLVEGQRHAFAWSGQAEVAMSIEGEGPVLLVEGEAMTDSVFIACYLDDIGSGPSLRPKDAYLRWEVMTWCRQIIERLAPAAAYLGCHAHLHDKLGSMDAAAFDACLNRIGSEDLRGRWGDIRVGNFDQDKLTDSRTKVGQTVEKCEARLAGREWLMGEFSIADLETYAWLAGMNHIVPEAFASAPLTTAWQQRVKSRPSVAQALTLASTSNPERAWAPGPEINRWG
jgi:GSH-dependent disulfide-bond oxidoreductase